MSSRGFLSRCSAAEQLDALNREYEKREQVNVTAESLYNQYVR